MELPTTHPEAVALAGDWHGNTRWACHVIRALAGHSDVVLQLGDFGIWPGREGRLYVDAIEQVAAASGITIYVTPGNHEDYDQIDALPVADDGLQWLRPHIALFPRGYRFRLGAWTGVSLGGAPSVDYHDRIPQQSWWEQEMLTGADVDHVVRSGPADLMVAHDAPERSTERVSRTVQTNPMRWPDDALLYAAEGRDLITRAADAVQPLVYAHGHYHVFDDSGPLSSPRFLSLDLDGTDTNVRLIDLCGPPDPAVRVTALDTLA